MEDQQRLEGETAWLRPVVEGDLPVFFSHQLDSEANYLAAFTRKDPADRDAFNRHWERIQADPRVQIRTIEVAGTPAGYVACYRAGDDAEVTYWLGREFWGRGIATAALKRFLQEVTVRPIYGRAASDNLASIRVLEKCGFTHAGETCGYAAARGEEIDEVILVLHAG